LDGILLGQLLRLAFTLVETLGQYVPEMIGMGVFNLGLFLSVVGRLQLLFPQF